MQNLADGRNYCTHNNAAILITFEIKGKIGKFTIHPFAHTYKPNQLSSSRKIILELHLKNIANKESNMKAHSVGYRCTHATTQQRRKE